MAFEDVQFPAAQFGSRWSRWIKIFVGRLISLTAPSFVARVAVGEMSTRIGFLERTAIAALVHRHTGAGTLDQLAPLHAWLWRGEQAVSFHAQAQARFDSFRLAHHSAIVAPIQGLFELPGEFGGRSYQQLCEIGCGSGLILEDIAQRLPNAPTLIGLDLSERQTQINQSRSVDSRIRFEVGDATVWIPAQGSVGTVYLTVAGVFEYFSRHSLQKLFAYIAAHQTPAAVALIEPVPADYDFEREDASRPYGFENLLGHNYPRLLREAGFTIRFQELQIVEGQTFLLLVAARCE